MVPSKVPTMYTWSGFPSRSLLRNSAGPERASQLGEALSEAPPVRDSEASRVGRVCDSNCRIWVQRPMHEFIDAWCQQGPSHHIALGTGDHSLARETFAEAMGFLTVRV